MVGIGEAEAIEDLQDEMNELRTQRRDNAQLVVQRPFAYFDGLVDAGRHRVRAGHRDPGRRRSARGHLPDPAAGSPAPAGYQEEAEPAGRHRARGGHRRHGVGLERGAPAPRHRDRGAAGAGRGEHPHRREDQAPRSPRSASRRRYQFLAILQQKILEPTQFVGPPKPEEGDREWSWYEIGVPSSWPASSPSTLSRLHDAG
jgi:hypothetical protein